MDAFPMDNDQAQPKVLNHPYIQGIHRLIQFFLRMPAFRGSGIIMGGLQKRLSAPAQGPLILPTHWGFRIKIRPSSDPQGLEERIYRTGVYELGTMLQLKSLIRPGDFLIDVGANIGWMSLWMARQTERRGQVWAFEPHPGILPDLQENISLNAFSQIRLFSVALGSASNRMTLFDNPHINRGGASLIDSAEKANTSHLVKTRTLDSYIQEMPKAPRLIKIDVEGWELEVLKGAVELLKAPQPPVLVLEYSLERPAHPGEDELRNFLTEQGYSIWHQKHGKERWSPLVQIKPGDPFPEHDNLFCFPQK
jgi:FkbM family methyltransferase